MLYQQDGYEKLKFDSKQTWRKLIDPILMQKFWLIPILILTNEHIILLFGT